MAESQCFTSQRPQRPVSPRCVRSNTGFLPPRQRRGSPSAKNTQRPAGSRFLWSSKTAPESFCLSPPADLKALPAPGSPLLSDESVCIPRDFANNGSGKPLIQKLIQTPHRYHLIHNRSPVLVSYFIVFQQGRACSIRAKQTGNRPPASHKSPENGSPPVFVLFFFCLFCFFSHCFCCSCQLYSCCCFWKNFWSCLCRSP